MTLPAWRDEAGRYGGSHIRKVRRTRLAHPRRMATAQEGAFLVTAHRIRHALAVLAALLGSLAWTSAGTPLTAAAAVASGCNANTCRWSQEDQGNWQPGSGQSPKCSVCISWPVNADGSVPHLPYYNGYSGRWASTETNWAAGQWSSLPYRSPVFYLCNSCGGPPLQYMAQQLPNNECGVTQDYYTATQGGQGTLTEAQVYLNSYPSGQNGSWWGYNDGPVTGNDQANCDGRWTLLHETGHAFAEGHSSVPSDLMYVRSNNVEQIDGDANDMMGQVYGSGGVTCEDNYCGGNADVKVPLPIGVQPMTPDQIKQMLVEKAVAAAVSVQAEANDAHNIAASEENATIPRGLCASICDPPPGGPAQPKPTPPPLPR